MWTDRTQMLLGEEGLRKLQESRVAVVGVGGVGGYAAEMLVRAGVGHIALIDSDDVSETNINRQIIALHSTVGHSKCEVMRERMLDINPALDVTVVPQFIEEANVAPLLDPLGVDYVVDAIDTLSPKIALIQYCLAHGVKLVSSMGAGAKMDATTLRIADISKTCQCPLAHALRKRLHRLGIDTGFQAVFSYEKPHRESIVAEESRNKVSQVGSISYIPAAFGCACAQAMIAEILG